MDDSLEDSEDEDASKIPLPGAAESSENFEAEEDEVQEITE